MKTPENFREPHERRTYFLDVDGTLLDYVLTFEESMKAETLAALPMAREKTQEWHCRGDEIIITTARPESMRKVTERQLHNAGIVFNSMIMGIGSGVRILVNDVRENATEPKALAYNVVRNVDGLQFIH